MQADAQVLLSTFRRFVSPGVVERLLADPEQARLGGSLQSVTVLFADLRGYTPLAERLEPCTLIEVLNGHLTVAADAVLEADGTISHFSGDQLMALFNAPLPQPDHALRAALAAVGIRRRLATFHAGLPDALRMAVGVGIATGEAVVGHIGAQWLLHYTAVGDTVNLAERLQGLAQGGEILVSDATRRALGQAAHFAPRGLTLLRGRSQPTAVFELQALEPPPPQGGRLSEEADGG